VLAIDPIVSRLAAALPRDAGRILELRGPEQDGLPTLARRWNPGLQVASVVGRELPPPEVFADLRRRLGAVDAVVLQAGIADRLPRERLAAAAACLEGGPLLAVLPAAGDGFRFLEAGLRAANLRADQAQPLAGAGDGLVLVRAVRADRPFRRLLVNAMTLRPLGGVNDKRIDEPGAFLATLPGVRFRGSQTFSEAPVAPGTRKLALLHRRITKSTDLGLYRELLRRGYLMVAEFDDHPSRWPEIEAHGFLSFRAVHAVQTSTPVLGALFAGYGVETMVFANQMAELPAEPPARPGPVRLFAGAFNRWEEWSELLEPLNRLLGRAGGGVAVEVVHDRRLFDALETPHKTFTPTCPYATYLKVLARCQIALLPLADTLFNRAKSDLKFIESAAHHVACLASPVVYADSLVDGETGLLFRDPAEFGERLARLIGDAALRETLAARAFGHVREQRLLAQHFRRRHAWYHALFERKEELEARLLERVPALRG
jgi:glycosyltransferase involved in cell wall biosynthesis